MNFKKFPNVDKSVMQKEIDLKKQQRLNRRRIGDSDLYPMQDIAESLF